MLVFLHTPVNEQQSTRIATPAGEIRVDTMPYLAAFASARLPRATYVFTDFERLAPPDFHAAVVLFRSLRDAGLRVLNDPSRILGRYGLLRRLHEAGINRFDAYRVDECVRPERWPVFLRSEHDFGAAVSDLLHSWDEVQSAVERTVAAGGALRHLLIIEYAGEPVRPGLYRKLGTFRVGDHRVPHWCAHEDRWFVKYGKLGIAPPELYDEELTIVRDDPFGEIIGRVFDLAHVDYGRVDFGLLGGEAQVFEVNTKPAVQFFVDHPHPARRESYRLFKARYLTALAALNCCDEGPPVVLDHPVFAGYKQRAELARVPRSIVTWR